MSARASWLIFAVASGLAVAAGAAVLAMAGSPVSTWARNPLAWVLGAAAAFAAAKLSGPRHTTAVIAISFVALAATFAAAPVQGVHRWLDLGPLHINAAALALPAMLASIAWIARTPVQLAVVAATGAILVLQPDASQASAFAAASAVVLLARGGSSLNKLMAVVICAAIAIGSWLRPDTLQRVPQVEGIFALAAANSFILAAIAAAALAAACLAPLAVTRTRTRGKEGALALATYFALSALSPLVGAYPVPLVGLGMSFPLGWWLGVALASSRVEGRAS